MTACFFGVSKLELNEWTDELVTLLLCDKERKRANGQWVVAVIHMFMQDKRL